MKKIIVLNLLSLFLINNSFGTTGTKKQLIKEKKKDTFNTNKKKENTKNTDFLHCLKTAKKELNAQLIDQQDKALLTTVYKEILNNNANAESVFYIKTDTELAHIFKQSSLQSQLMYLNDECEGLQSEITKLLNQNILSQKEQSTLSQLEEELIAALSKKDKIEQKLLLSNICKTE